MHILTVTGKNSENLEQPELDVIPDPQKVLYKRT